MSGDRLDDPALARRLARACRAAGARRAWWRRWRAPGQGAVVLVLLRCGCVLACLGLGAASAGDAAALQLLTLAGLIVLQTRSAAIAGALGADAGLAVLARLPVADARILDHQLRPLRRTRWWAAADATAFWCGAWTIAGWTPCWWALPGLALGHALACQAVALWIWRRWSPLGCLPLLVLFLLGLAVMQREWLPQVWAGAEPLLAALGWLTPWGWLVRLGALLHSAPAWAAAGVAAVAVAAALAARLAHARLRRTWRLDPAWRELAGRPAQTLVLDDDDDAAPATVPIPAGDGGFDRHWRRVWDRPAAAVLAEQGWAGRRCAAGLDADHGALAGALAPEAPSDRAWAWFLLLATVPAACLLVQVSPLWGAGLLTLAPALRRRWWWMGPGAALLVLGGLHPGAGRIAAIAGPSAIALFGTMTVTGGRWRGLPVTTTPLGGLPRTWRQQHLIVLRFTRLRLLAALPVAGLAAAAGGLGFHPALAAVVLAGWALALLCAPWMCALVLTKRRLDGAVDLALGRWWLSLASFAFLLVHGIAGCAVLVGAGMLTKPAPLPGLAMLAGGVLTLAISAPLHVRLLHRAYRRSLDFIPPPG